MEKTLRVIKSQEEIQRRVLELASEIRSSTQSDNLTIVGMLEDAFVFLADLIRALDLSVSCCFMKVARHRHGGQTEVVFTSEFDPRGCDVLLVDGILGTGITLDYVTRQLSERGVKSIRTCVLVDRPDERRIDLQPDFKAFTSQEQSIVGYGLGIQNRYRQLPYLATMD